MKLSEIKGVDAIEVVADIIDPVTSIMADEEVKKLAEMKPKPPTLLIAKTVLKRQKKAILEILAILHGEDPKTYNPSLIELPILLVNLINEIQSNEELQSLFHSQPQMSSSVSSGAVMENTEETKTM